MIAPLPDVRRVLYAVAAGVLTSWLAMIQIRTVSAPSPPTLPREPPLERYVATMTQRLKLDDGQVEHLRQILAKLAVEYRLSRETGATTGTVWTRYRYQEIPAMLSDAQRRVYFSSGRTVRRVGH